MATPFRCYLLRRYLADFTFSQGNSIFTAGMAKRTGPGPFAAAPIVQSDWANTGTPDVVSVGRGSQISGYWYDNFDPYQGGGFVFWTPEQATGVGSGGGYIWYASSNYNLEYDYANDRYQLTIGGQTVTVAATLVAGTREALAWGYDTKNEIDGTNYAYLSRNDAQTYGMSTQPTVSAPDATIYVGSNGTGSCSNGIIEGLVFVRRVPWTGSYGTDMGEGDIVNAHYAAAAGADVALSIGSWDTTFSMPTNSSTGALVTGAGEAWSHPHSSNVPEDWYLDDGYYGGAEHAIGFNGDTTIIDCGSNATIDNIPAADYTVDFWCRLNSAGEESGGRLFEKGSFYCHAASTYLRIRAVHATTSAEARLPYTYDGKWHHIEAIYDVGTLTFEHFFLDGRDLIYSVIVGAGAYSGDAANVLYVGNVGAGTRCLDGDLAWMRFSNNKRHTAGFIPPRAMPAVDGNTIEQWGMADGAGANVVASVTSPACDGTLANGTWVHPWEDQGTPLDLQGIEFDGATTSVVIADNAAYQDLHAGAMTVRAWIRADGWGETGNGRIFDKEGAGNSGWMLSLSTEGIYARVNAATDALAASGKDEISADGKLVQVTMQYDAGGDRNIYLWVSGIPIASYSTRQTGVGAIVTDVGNNLYYGNNSVGTLTFDGLLAGWADISNILRYTNGEAFIPESPTNPPAPDGNTVWQTNHADGAGTTLTDVSATGVNGTITFGTGRWWNTRDMDVNAIGEKVYPFGNMFGVDAANEGPHQTWTGLTAGWDYVARVAMYPSADGRGQARIVAYDEIGAAAISTFDGPTYYGVHSGANDSATLIAAAGKFPQSLIGATVYNITDGSLGTITACSGDYTTITANLAGGTDNDWDTNDVYRVFWPGITNGFASHPWIETFTFELPAGCTSLSLRLLSASAEGFFFVGQVELLRQLITNPSLEVGAGDPWIPTGWVSTTLDAGDTQASTTGGGLIHSGAEAMQWNPGAVTGELIETDGISVAGQYYGSGVWVCGNTTGFLWGAATSDRGTYHYIQNTPQLPTSHAPVWNHHVGVLRALFGNMLPSLWSDAGAGGARYTDDAYWVSLNSVSLTVTPASEANSAESGGIRVDGRDTETQATDYDFRMDRGKLGPIWATPRHSIANAQAFGQAVEYLIDLYEDANNYIRAYRTTNTVTLTVNAQGAGAQTDTWAATGLWNADARVKLWIEYDENKAELYIGGTWRCFVLKTVFATDFTVAVAWGHRQDGTLQFDGVIEEV